METTDEKWKKKLQINHMVTSNLIFIKRSTWDTKWNDNKTSLVHTSCINLDNQIKYFLVAKPTTIKLVHTSDLTSNIVIHLHKNFKLTILTSNTVTLRAWTSWSEAKINHVEVYHSFLQVQLHQKFKHFSIICKSKVPASKRI